LAASRTCSSLSFAAFIKSLVASSVFKRLSDLMACLRTFLSLWFESLFMAGSATSPCKPRSTAMVSIGLRPSYPLWLAQFYRLRHCFCCRRVLTLPQDARCSICVICCRIISGKVVRSPWLSFGLLPVETLLLLILALSFVLVDVA
jgi:hypothetical protein